VPPWLRSLNALRLGEDVRASLAALRPVLDDLVDALERQQRAMAALVTGLAAPIASTPRLLRSRRRRRRILRGRQRRVARVPAQTPLELGHASLQPLIRLDQPLVRLDQRVELKQQPDSRRAITIQDRLRLGTLHTTQVR
jgi:hypothetical protein